METLPRLNADYRGRVPPTSEPTPPASEPTPPASEPTPRGGTQATPRDATQATPASSPASSPASTRVEPAVIAVLGPTAAGKTALSLELARSLGGEIVNADAMQLYRGMDIGTAKLRPHEWGGVAHHAFDLWDVTEPASVAQYQRVAREAIDSIRGRDRPALLVGGSGLYVRAVLERFEFPGTDPKLRARLEKELAARGPEPLHARLTAIDPIAAARILPGNGRRIVRALEVHQLTGGAFRAVLPEPTPHYCSVQLGVDLDTALLDERIARRVEQMWRDGLVDEVRALERAGLRQGRTAGLALGYQQVLAMLAGECDEEQAIADTIRATRRFVRRQRSWFRRDPRIVWLDGADPNLAASALAVLARATAAPSRGD
jgi:tRNA dimethylallyltransferase